MTDYIFFMHDDAIDPAIANDSGRWSLYLAGLRQSGQFAGGSSIGGGACFRQDGSAGPAPSALSGFIRLRAENLAEASAFLSGNPVYEAGGTVEIRELPRDE
jgi:hypothetical protein